MAKSSRPLASSASSQVSALAAFFQAIARGDAKRVRKALDSHPEWATSRTVEPGRGKSGHTALLLAAAHGHLEVVDVLIPLCDSAAFAGRGKLPSPLQRAAAEGHATCVQRLRPLSNAMEVAFLGEIALTMAAREGHLDCVNALLTPEGARHADVQGNTPLISAAAAGHLDCVQALLPVSDLRQQTLTGYNALGVAARWAGSNPQGPALVRALLPVSDARTIAKDGSCALTHVARYGPFELVGELAAHSDVQFGLPTGQSKIIDLLLHKAPAKAFRDYLRHCPNDFLVDILPDAISTALSQGKSDCVQVMLDVFPLEALPATIQCESDAIMRQLLCEALAHKELEALGQALPSQKASLEAMPGDQSASGSSHTPRRRRL